MNTNNKKNYIITILIISILLINSVFTTVNAEESESDIMDVSSFLESIYDKLIDDAMYDNDNSLRGWLYYSNNTGEPEVLGTGYRIGIVGIGDFMLDLYEHGIISSTHYIEEIIQTLNKNLYQLNDKIYWDRFLEFENSAWTSQRYGISGIMAFLARCSTYNLLDNLSDYLNPAFRWLYSWQTDSGAFYMEDDANSFMTTDVEYGIAGIALSFLKIYDLIGNQTFLNHAKDMGDWISEHGRWEDNKFSVPWSLSLDDEYYLDSFTGIATGLAGILDLMIKLYDRTEEQQYLELAQGIGNYLIFEENNGYWEKSVIGYITNIGDNNNLIGYMVGASGIADKLLDLYQLTGDEILLEVSSIVETNINSLIHGDGSVSISPNHMDRKYTGFTMGSAGITQFHLNLYNRFGIDRNLNKSNLIISHLLDLLNQEGLIPVDENNPDKGYAYNIDQGLAGIGKVLITYLDLTAGTDDKYDSYYSKAQEKSLDPNLRNLLILGSILFIFIILRKIKQ